MKKLFIVIIMLTIPLILNAQKKEKIKGNKIVVDVFKDLEDFNAIEIEDNLKVTIAQSVTNGYHLMTDENLLDVVKFNVINGVLKIYSTHNIVAKKELEINLTFVKINSIILKDDAQLSSKSKLILNELLFVAFNNASYDLDLKVENSNFKFHKSTSGKLVLNGGAAIMFFDENAFMKGKISLDNLELTANNRTDIILSGDVNNLNIKSTGSSRLKAKDLKISYATTNSENNSDIQIYVTKELRIYAKDKSSIYVYGHPEIKVDGLSDKSQIIKK